MYKVDCLKLFRCLRDGCIDTVFADPPFNLGKDYGNGSGHDEYPAHYALLYFSKGSPKTFNRDEVRVPEAREGIPQVLVHLFTKPHPELLIDTTIYRNSSRKSTATAPKNESNGLALPHSSLKSNPL